ncbi:PLDc N-terminal domain-containing protein [Mangrovivirga sp. M17]|uniref:PLDc N-terminal domain-containing protein n=1 Tax=Mangrovivirga halotolerans TaxID=2993936 RepID=A0ABT3RR68_9BACT|nr:PLDc N-terminal domain-containing protein [Mangrovivirga halotolerans]MCX2744120.1 PLDc N-terminal domain-containing protein [Mangrovivirga halotolerans]
MEFSIAVILLFIAGFFLAYLIPIIIIAKSDKTSGTEKILWILAVLFISWFAFLFYLFLAPVEKKI